MKKLSNTEAELKISVAYKKACTSKWLPLLNIDDSSSSCQITHLHLDISLTQTNTANICISPKDTVA